MATAQKKEELRDAAIMMLPETVVALGYIEHQMDLIGTITMMLVDSFKDNMTDDQLAIVNMLRDVLKHSSIDFANINDQLQSYKIPKTIENKAAIRLVQEQYLLAQIREGIFG